MYIKGGNKSIDAHSVALASTQLVKLTIFQGKIDNMVSAETAVYVSAGASVFATIGGFVVLGGPITWIVGLVAVAGFLAGNAPAIYSWFDAKSDAEKAWKKIPR